MSIWKQKQNVCRKWKNELDLKKSSSENKQSHSHHTCARLHLISLRIWSELLVSVGIVLTSLEMQVNAGMHDIRAFKAGKQNYSIKRRRGVAMPSLAAPTLKKIFKKEEKRGRVVLGRNYFWVRHSQHKGFQCVKGDIVGSLFCCFCE